MALSQKNKKYKKVVQDQIIKVLKNYDPNMANMGPTTDSLFKYDIKKVRDQKF
jgi:hypothetical protein